MSKDKKVKKPKGFETALSAYRAVAYDSSSGEPISWGFQLVEQVGNERFEELRKHGDLTYIGGAYGGSWALIIKKLTRKEAIKKYGPVTNEDLGPRGGFRSITFGDKTFLSKQFRKEEA